MIFVGFPIILIFNSQLRHDLRTGLSKFKLNNELNVVFDNLASKIMF